MIGRAKLAKLSGSFVVLALTSIISPLASASAPIIQASPTSNTTNVAGSATFTDTLAIASGANGPVTFLTDSSTDLVVSASGQVSTTGTLSVIGSPYTASGTDSDMFGDTGTWIYSLSVTNTITQESPTSNTTDVIGSSTFVDDLATDSGANGSVDYLSLIHIYAV